MKRKEVLCRYTLNWPQSSKKKLPRENCPPGIRIPSETKLAKQYDVSPMTVRQAISVLVDEDLVKRVHGSGTFVKRIEVGATTFNLEVLNRVLSDTDALTVHVLKSNISRVNGKEGNVLGLKPGDPVIQVERLIFHENQPFCFQSAYLPFDPRAPVVENMLDTTGLAGLFLSNSNSGYKKGELRAVAHPDERPGGGTAPGARRKGCLSPGIHIL